MDVMESTLSIHVGFAGLITRTKKQVKGFDSSVLYSLCLTGYFVSQPITGLHLGSSVLYSLCLTSYFVSQPITGLHLGSSVLYSLCLTGYFVSQPITGLHLGSSVLYSLCLTGYFVTQSAPSQNGTEIQTKATGQIEFQIWQKTPIISCVSPKRSATLYC